ncbi:hypothetical protein IMCC9480_1412 [Oxalobacteraceae bacterium IMCC9480]|nr:hypothetical protein IMCC9480_1412 [Oxalobacteraceae bacterium IMCC9480]NDP58133.1 hypothetical protein [Oxalobacteraceae bacterium]
MRSNQWTVPFVLVAMSGAAVSAHATSCMVMGERTAKVQSAEGIKSPVFLAADCESLRLVSGKAMVSWVSRDGKPHFEPIGADGTRLLPTAGAEERSGNVVWAELASKREVERPAFMRALSEERPARVYIPPEGLALAARPDADFQILALEGDTEKLVFDKKASDTTAILLTRTHIQPGGMYIVEWHHAATVERLKWQALGSAESTHIDEQYQQIRSTISDEAQRRIMMGMLFEQLRLRVNMAAELSRP